MARLGALFVVFVVCLGVVLSTWQASFAAGDSINIADPVIGAGWENLLAGMPGGTQLRAGVELGDGCKMSQVELGGGYLNISVHGPYAIGNPTDGKLLAAIVCDEPFSGIFAYGDNDHNPPSEVCFDDFCWTPPFGADTWHYWEVEDVRYIVINSYGDSGFWTLFKNTNGTATSTPTPVTATPASTPSVTATPVETTPTPTVTIVSTLLPSPTPTATSTMLPTPTRGATDVTDLDPATEPLVADPQLYLPHLHN